MRALGALTLLLVFSGCARDEAPKPSSTTAEAVVSSSAPAATQAPPPPSPPAADVDDKLLSLEEDFEQEAAREISPTNLESELNRLEKEINEPELRPPPKKGTPEKP